MSWKSGQRGDREGRPGQDVDLVRQRDPGDLVADAVDDLAGPQPAVVAIEPERRGVEEDAAEPAGGHLAAGRVGLRSRRAGGWAYLSRSRRRPARPGPRPAGRPGRGTASRTRSRARSARTCRSTPGRRRARRRSRARGPGGRAALVDGDLHQPGDRVVERLERVDRQDLVLDVLQQEAALGVVAAVAERHLGQVVRAEAEELGLARRSRRRSARRAGPRSSSRTCSRPRRRRPPRPPSPRPRGAPWSPRSSFTWPTSGIMILAIGLPPACLTAIRALRIARVWTFTKSGIISPRRQPRRPSIGFCSCSALDRREQLLVLVATRRRAPRPG